jgi:hypothetical protein
MYRALAAWLTERPWRAAIIAACFGLFSLQSAMLFGALASAVPVLVLLERGGLAGANVLLAGSVSVIGTLLYFGQSIWVALSYAVFLFGLPTLMGELLRRSGSLTLVFQLTVLISVAVLCGIYALVPAPAAIWEQLMRQAFNTLAQAGIPMDEKLIAPLARTLWGAVIAVLAFSSLGSVFLARWCQALLHAPGAFGGEFQQLRTGIVLGTVLVAVTIGSFATDIALLDSLAWVAIMALGLQGLATAHRTKAEGHLQRGWLVAIYVLLIVPLSMFVTVALLAAWGLADHWRRMRLGALRS